MNSKTRTALSAGVLAVALGLGATAQASAGAPRATAQASAGAPRSVSGKSSDNLTRVADFYGSYIDAVTDEDSGSLGQALRAHALTPAFQKQLAAWEDREHADGVLRAQNVPLAWKVTDNGTARNHTEAVVTLTWSRNSTTKVYVDVTRDTHKIYRIGAKALGAK